MSAIFGTPIAAIFLAIELLLFEFSPKTILPVALACITGAAGHHLLFDQGAVFAMPNLATPSNGALAVYSLIGLVIGFLSLILTKAVYFIEDAFEKLPIHWFWWPAMGGIAVGIVGYFYPHTLGVGYDNITHILSGSLTLSLALNLFFFKFLSWAIALGSGTSGGTLAPLLTIGGAGGAILGSIILSVFPDSGINIPMAALIGMSAMFAGASRAYLTSITFALEATMQSHALLPLLGACTSSYLVSFFLMENTIMTEKIARRGVMTPDSYEADPLEKLTVAQVITEKVISFNLNDTVNSARQWLAVNHVVANYFLVTDADNSYKGTLNVTDIYNPDIDPESSVSTIIKHSDAHVRNTDTLRKAVELMATEETGVLPILSPANKITGMLVYEDILSAYRHNLEDNESATIQISLKRRRLKMMANGKKLKGK
jgi:hypothetical protein